MNSQNYILYPDEDSRFPNLKTSGFRITSPKSNDYNCMAWATHDKDNFWWPDPIQGFWPNGVKMEESLSAFVAAFETQGFVPSENAALEPGFEKIAIYLDETGTPSHAARQLPNGKWTSKLGPDEDIEHALDGLVGPEYGVIAQILRRPLMGLPKWFHVFRARIFLLSQRFPSIISEKLLSQRPTADLSI